MQGAFPTTRKAYPTSATLAPLPFPLPIDRPQSNLNYRSDAKYVCKTCGRDGWFSSFALDRHEQSHLDNSEKYVPILLDPNRSQAYHASRQHHCYECGSSFSQRTALKTHTNIHLEQGLPDFRHTCSASVSSPNRPPTVKLELSFEREQSHLDNSEKYDPILLDPNRSQAYHAPRAHPCQYCGKSFSQRTALNTHINIHTGERPHKCRKGCSQRFSDPSSRTRHEKELHTPGFGFKCSRPGCNESVKRKLAFVTHMEVAHGCPRGLTLPESIFTAAKNKCAEDFEESLGKSKFENTEEGSDMPNENEWDEDKPLFNGKRPRSASTSDDHLQPPPTKKQAFDPSPPRRNAVGSIAMPPAIPLAHSHAGHERSDSDDCSNSTASSFADAFSGAYNPTGRAFTASDSDNCSNSTASSFADAFSGAYNPTGRAFKKGSPPTQSLNSVQDYRNAIDRVVTPPMQAFPVPPMRLRMHPGVGDYGAVPDGVPPRAPVAIPQPISYCSNPAGPPWAGHNPSYGSEWTLGNEVAQTPHGVIPAHLAHEDPSARGGLNPSRSDLPRGINNSGIHLSTGEHQAEHTSSNPHLGQSLGPFGDHQALTRSSSEHNNSSYPGSHISMYQLESQQNYLGYPQQ
ncbi:hypothetical protein RSAG8_01342, partial [Rhizoctonia solani AG-8 WAC10335]